MIYQHFNKFGLQLLNDKLVSLGPGDHCEICDNLLLAGFTLRSSMTVVVGTMSGNMVPGLPMMDHQELKYSKETMSR